MVTDNQSKSAESDSESNISLKSFTHPLAEVLSEIEPGVGESVDDKCENGMHPQDLSFADKPAQQLLSQLGCTNSAYADLSCLLPGMDLRSLVLADVMILGAPLINQESDEAPQPELIIKSERITRLLNSAKTYINTDLIAQENYLKLLPPAVQSKEEEEEFAKQPSLCNSNQHFIAGVCHAQEIDVLVAHNNIDGKAVVSAKTGAIDIAEPALLLLSNAVLNFKNTGLSSLSEAERAILIKGSYKILFAAALKEQRNYIFMSSASFDEDEPALYFNCLFEVAKEYPALNIIYNPTVFTRRFQRYIHANANANANANATIEVLNQEIRVQESKKRRQSLQEEAVLEKSRAQTLIDAAKNTMAATEQAIANKFLTLLQAYSGSNIIATKKDIVRLAAEFQKAKHACAIHHPSNPKVILGLRDIGDKWKAGIGEHYKTEEHLAAITTAPLNSIFLNPEAYQSIVPVAFEGECYFEAADPKIFARKVMTEGKVNLPLETKDIIHPVPEKPNESANAEIISQSLVSSAEIIDAKVFDKTAIEKETKSFIFKTLRRINTHPIFSGKTIEAEKVVEKDKPAEKIAIAVTKTMKSVDEMLKSDAGIEQINSVFQASAADKFNFRRSWRAQTLYSSLGNGVQAYLAKQALREIILTFRDIPADDIKGTFLFKHRYTIEGKKVYLPSTAEKIFNLYKKAESASQGVTWQFAIEEAQRLLIENYCPSNQTSYRSPFRSVIVKEIYTDALDIIQYEYHYKCTAYRHTKFIDKLNPERFNGLLELFEANKIPESLPQKTAIINEINSIKELFSNVQDSDPNKVIAMQLNALEHLAFSLFNYASKIPKRERGVSQLYKSLILTIAKYQCYDVENLNDDGKVAVIKAIETKMSKESEYYRFMSTQKFKDQREHPIFISNPKLIPKVYHVN